MVVNKLLIQWGVNHEGTIYYPIAYSNQVFIVVAGSSDVGDDHIIAVAAWNFTLTITFLDAGLGGQDWPSQPILWISIGY